MPRVILALCALSLSACFDFTATQEAALGGRCGDIDHYCAPKLTCRDDVCIRDTGSEIGELCNDKVTCSSIDKLVCVSNVCFVACDTLNCGDHGGCVQNDTGTMCACDPGYVEDKSFCASDRGTACSANGIQHCGPGLVCLNEQCAEPCENAYCEHGTHCEESVTPHECQCAFGFVLENDTCVSACAGKACSNVGTCFTDPLGQATCDCGDSGLVPSEADCVDPNCIVPTPHVETICVSGHLYYFNSCHKQESDIADTCGGRGCVAGAKSCPPVEWTNRDIVFDGYTVADFDFVVRGDRDLIGAAATTNGVVVRAYANTWQEFAAGNSIAFAGAASKVSLAATSSGSPAVAFINSANVGFAQWNGTGWVGYASSGTGSIQGYSGKMAVNVQLDSSDRPYIATTGVYAGGGLFYGNAVTSWNGSAWTLLDSSTQANDLEFLTSYANPDYSVPLTIETGSTPIVSTADTQGTKVFYWSGDNWLKRGATTADVTLGATAVAAHSTTLASAYVSNKDVFVQRWIGSWSASNVSSGTSGTDSVTPSLAVANNGTIYVAWREVQTGGDAVYVKFFDGTNWLNVVEPSSNRGAVEATYGGTVGAPLLRVGGSTVCVTWPGNGNVRPLRCATL